MKERIEYRVECDGRKGGVLGGSKVLGQYGSERQS